ncbi:MAG: phosphoglycerate kinase, partial [Candidatus Woesebacteria bacterium]|nr:phosphoglycerate kinase [Candidatus Woesebacteria bacterium]
EIIKSGTIILAGPMGKYEDEGHRQGTERIFKAVASSSAFKITGGGDSLSVLSIYDLKDKFDWVSVGGGAMLEFLAKRTLPGIKALESANLNMEGG